jgi:hypothetical protein
MSESIWDSPELADLKQDGPGEYVKFAAPGDSCEGFITSLGIHTWDDGKSSPQIFLYSEDDGDRVLTATQSALKSLLAQKRPEQGDHLAVTYTGDRTTAKGYQVKQFEVVVTKADTEKPAAAAPAAEGKLPAEALAALQAAGIDFKG